MSNTWIYHERQKALLCGLHALNNLCQAEVFDQNFLRQIARQLDQQELAMLGAPSSPGYQARLQEGSYNVDPAGNFSIQVLTVALQQKYGLTLSSISQKDIANAEPTEYDGFILHREAHWFAIRKVNNRFWNLDSMKERPEIINHFKLATTVQGFQSQGYMAFVTTGKLPPTCDEDRYRNRGKLEYWWKESGLLSTRTADAITAADDPWRNVGSGKKLGAKTTLTEEEQLEEAIKASMKKRVEYADVHPPSEPEANEKNTIRTQLRLPDGKRKVRRFRENETIAMLYAVVASLSGDSNGRLLELKAGFPPQLLDAGEITVADAGLGGAVVQCKWS
mmetsp:Transcript_8006/g.10144  ORF Transcript_8006/g.10144 Transcript_8006/m.10144 type:complete len:335 (-) Transcript_8006:1276-2280(-)